MARNDNRWRDEGRDWRDDDRWRGEGRSYGVYDRDDDRSQMGRGGRDTNDYYSGDYGRGDYERGSSRWQGGRESYRDYGSRESGNREYGNRDAGGRDSGGSSGSYGSGYGSGYGGRRGSSGFGGYGGAGYPREDRMERDYGTSYYGSGGLDDDRRGFGADYGRGDYGRTGSGRGDYGHGTPAGRERGFLERAGDEIASWFGDDDAERRRHEDERRVASHRGRGPRGYSRSDDRIRDDLNDRLTDDHYIDASEIDISVSNGEVTLSGTVDHRSTKRRAEDLAESISGVTHVQNNLRVRQSTGSSVGSGMSSGMGAAGLMGGGTGAGASAIADMGGVGRGSSANATGAGTTGTGTSSTGTGGAGTGGTGVTSDTGSTSTRTIGR